MASSITLLMSVCGLLVFAGFMVWAGVGDVRSFKITNKLNVAIAAAFVVLAVPMGMGWLEIFGHVKVAAITLAITLSMFFIGIFGGGDAKMAGATALWLGPTAMIPFIYFTALSGGVLVLILIIGRRLAKAYGLPRSPKWARRMLRRHSAVPYGVALGIGALIAVPNAVWFPDHFFG
jgi:prepilin peptidase CpaA